MVVFTVFDQFHAFWITSENKIPENLKFMSGVKHSFIVDLNHVIPYKYSYQS